MFKATVRRTAALCVAAAGFAATAHAQAQWKLTETLRIGGDETGPGLLVYTKAIDADAKGRIYIEDRKSQDIRVFGPDGKFIKTIGRLGSGPGEFRDAEGIAFARDGRLWVRDAANARFSVFNSEGVFEKAWTMKFCFSQGAWTPAMDRSGRIIDDDCAVGNGRMVKELLVGYHTDMSRVDTLSDKPACGTTELNEAGTWITRTARGGSYRSIPWAPRSQSALASTGELWCASNTSRYEVVRLKAGARDTTRIVGTAPVVPVSAFEKDSVIALIDSKAPTGLDFSRIPKTKPAIDRLTVDEQDRLWVRHTNAKGAIVFDVFSPNGRIIATAELGVYNSSVYQPFVVRGDNLYTVVLDQDDVQHVARFRIGR